MIVYRLSLGGAGAPIAVGVALTSAALGVGLYIYRKQHASRLALELIGLGLAVALQTLVWSLLLPTEIAVLVIRAVALPIILIYPASSWLFGTLLLAQERHAELEADLNAERNMLRTLIDNVPDYIFIKDRTRRYVLSNLAHARAAGVSAPADLIGKTAAAFFPPEYVNQHDADDEAVLGGESIIAQERQTVNQDGEHIWVMTTKVPLRDAQRNIRGVVGISSNISVRKQAEEALQQERNLLRTLIDAVPANVYIKDAQSRFVDANIETIHKFGMTTRGDLIGKTDFDFFGPDLATKYLTDEQTVLQSGQPLLNLEEPTVDQRTQQLRWLLTTKAPIRNEQGEVMGLVGVGLDITGRKQAEEALQVKGEAERQFQTALKALYKITIELTQIDDLDDFYRHVVEFALERLDFDRFGLLLYDAEHARVIGTYGTDAQGKLVAEHRLLFDPALLTGILQRTLSPTERLAFDEHAQLFSNLEPIGFGWNAAAALWSGEQSLGWVTADNAVQHQAVSKVQLDILALYAQTVGTLLGRKRAEQDLRENEAKLETFFEVLPVGVSILNSNGQIVEMNPALERILGISMDGLKSGAHHSRTYLFGDGSPMERNVLPSARARVEQKAIHDVEIGVLKEDKTIVWTSVSAAPLPGTNAGVIIVTADITERKRTEKQAFALAAEQQRVKLLQKFITDVSHDFRTPLTIIGTSAFILSKTTDPTKLTRCSRRIEEQIARLGVLLDSFVELADLEQQASLLQFHPVDVDELVKTILERTQPTAAEKHQELEYHGGTHAALVLGERTVLQKAISNIVINALHFTPVAGKITLRLYTQDQTVVIEVTDTGVGIRAEDLPHIFDSFYRVDNARSTESGGTGLGLSIAKRIVELMKGHIEVASEFGAGSVFKIYLPIYH